MNSAIEHILLRDHLSSDDLKDIEDACKADASLARLIRNWAAVRNHISHALQDSVPDSRLLVLYALDQAGGDMLSANEEVELQAAQAQIRLALEKHPALDAIVGRIQHDATDFDSVWTEHTTAVSAVIPPVASIRAARSASSGNIFRRIGRSVAVNPGWYGIAAAITLLIASLVVFQQMKDLASGMTIGTPDGKVNLVTLPDGSKARLAPGSTISIRSADSFDRHLTLTGSAFFDVTPSELQFQIETSNAHVVVFGTSFGVTTEAESAITEVTLVSGSVSLSSADRADAIMLEPGELSRVVGNTAPSAPQIVDLESALSWSDLFVFKDAPLSHVSEKLSTRFDVMISVDEDLRDRTVTGTFAPENGVRFILDAVSAALNVQIESDDSNQVYRITS